MEMKQKVFSPFSSHYFVDTKCIFKSIYRICGKLSFLLEVRSFPKISPSTCFIKCWGICSALFFLNVPLRCECVLWLVAAIISIPNIHAPLAFSPVSLLEISGCRSVTAKPLPIRDRWWMPCISVGDNEISHFNPSAGRSSVFFVT